MPLEIIGSGFGRTGTLTLKSSLEQLGFSKCYHMAEVLDNPVNFEHWGRVARGEPVDWEVVFDGFRATIDWPACHVWRELAERYPKAKVLHTVRSSPEKWFESFSNTIMPVMKLEPPKDDPRRPWWDAMNKLITVDTFHGRPDDKETAIAAYKKREADVRAAIDPKRLLVYDISEGWAPLCEFLGVPVPLEPMQRTNTTEEFQTRFADRVKP
ncbi:MAG TPA: sulfotransferase [Parvularculaceae bacterium]|nr:sulfotransferase [Parvularculaceae bacterium]